MEEPVGSIVERTVAALGVLAAIAEAVDDEQQYVRDLVLVWGARLRAVGAAATEAGLATPVGATAAVDWLCAEAGRVGDPHRAIDWLSTLPQAAILALGDAP